MEWRETRGQRGWMWRQTIGRRRWPIRAVKRWKIAGPERPVTPNPTPARWRTPTPLPVTPARGNKRMAVGTPKTTRHRPVRPMPVGCGAASTLEQILAAIAGVERRMEETVARMEARMMEGMKAVVADATEWEERTIARWMVDAEEREKRMAVKLLALEGMETEMTQKARWDLKQWGDLASVMKVRRRKIGEIKRAVDEVVAGMMTRCAKHPPWLRQRRCQHGAQRREWWLALSTPLRQWREWL